MAATRTTDEQIAEWEARIVVLNQIGHNITATQMNALLGGLVAERNRADMEHQRVGIEADWFEEARKHADDLEERLRQVREILLTALTNEGRRQALLQRPQLQALGLPRTPHYAGGRLMSFMYAGIVYSDTAASTGEPRCAMAAHSARKVRISIIGERRLTEPDATPPSDFAAADFTAAELVELISMLQDARRQIT